MLPCGSAGDGERDRGRQLIGGAYCRRGWSLLYVIRVAENDRGVNDSDISVNFSQTVKCICP